ncbi:glycine cleavage system aminomethyltransferase GcvT [Microbacterium sp. P02]|uniref:glycine cleavage system aminomethyltransferase GcvT n=1 Tax=Microbacterium sp. P02 TaxID=3366260 RepID=UPI00366DADD6
MTEPRYTALRERHEALGAAFTDFGGWMMPVRYTSDLAEHHAVRSAAGLFDISHMAEFSVSGDGAGEYLDHALAGRLSTMAVGKAKYSLILAEDGGVVDDVIVYRLEGELFLVIANAGNRRAAGAALSSAVDGHSVEVVDRSDDYSLIAVQGPAARQVLDATPGVGAFAHPLDDLPYYASMQASFDGTPLLIARTGYTGEDGYELLIPHARAVALWDALLTAGAPLDLVPAGLAARDTLRLEAGMPLYGHELSRAIVPAQVGLGRAVALDKESFIGKEGLIARSAVDSPVLVGLVSEGRRAGRAGYGVYDGDTRVGEITSGALSPTLGHPIAMALVAPSTSDLGTPLTIDVRGTRIPATVSTLPFYRRKK